MRMGNKVPRSLIWLIIKAALSTKQRPCAVSAVAACQAVADTAFKDKADSKLYHPRIHTHRCHKPINTVVKVPGAEHGGMNILLGS